MARKRKNNSISPDELLLNFADWTEPTKEEDNGEGSGAVSALEQSVSSEKQEIPTSPEPSVELTPSNDDKPTKNNSPSDVSNDSASVDLQYMEDTMFWALRQIDGIDDKNRTRLIAMETASIALSGIALHNIYELKSYAYGRVDGYQLVALYYSSFAVAFPNMLQSIPLTYAPQFHAAQDRFNDFIATHA